MVSTELFSLHLEVEADTQDVADVYPVDEFRSDLVNRCSFHFGAAETSSNWTSNRVLSLLVSRKSADLHVGTV